MRSSDVCQRPHNIDGLSSDGSLFMEPTSWASNRIRPDIPHKLRKIHQHYVPVSFSIIHQIPGESRGREKEVPRVDVGSGESHSLDQGVELCETGLATAHFTLAEGIEDGTIAFNPCRDVYVDDLRFAVFSCSLKGHKAPVCKIIRGLLSTFHLLNPDSIWNLPVCFLRCQHSD